MSGTDMYHRAKFDGGRCHRRRDICIQTNKNLAVANRSRVSCAHSTSRASMGLITP